MLHPFVGVFPPGRSTIEEVKGVEDQEAQLLSSNPDSTGLYFICDKRMGEHSTGEAPNPLISDEILAENNIDEFVPRSEQAATITKRMTITAKKLEQHMLES